MKKLNLSINDLKVESFRTDTLINSMKGTLKGQLFEDPAAMSKFESCHLWPCTDARTCENMTCAPTCISCGFTCYLMCRTEIPRDCFQDENPVED